MRTYDVRFSRYALRNRLMFLCQLLLPAVGPGSSALSTFLARRISISTVEKMYYDGKVLLALKHFKSQHGDE